MTTNKTKEILENLSPSEQDDIYRALWLEHVKEDIKTRMEETDEELTDTQIEYAAERYVYDGKYDCNQSYWNNIDNVINLAKENYN